MEVPFAELVSEVAYPFAYVWFLMTVSKRNRKFVMDWPGRTKGPGETEPFRVSLLVDRT